MVWVQWDDDQDALLSIMQQLPETLQGRDSAGLALLGYRELIVRHPEDFIPRFPRLLGSSVFAKQADGRVLQTFPEADFSLTAVRAELVQQSKAGAHQELSRTDWYVMRKVDTGDEIPEDTKKLRQSIRDHADWVAQDIAKTDARSLVEYRWTFPSAPAQAMVAGAPVIVLPTAPVEVPKLPDVPADVHTGAGFDPDADGVMGGNTDPSVVDPAPEPPPAPIRSLPPSTTDGPVPVFESEQPDEVYPHLDANGFPLVTAYAPTVEDTGPSPDQN